MICNISNSYLWISKSNVVLNAFRLMLVAFVSMISSVYADIVILRGDDVQGIGVQTMMQERAFSLSGFKSFVQGESFNSIIKRFFADQGDLYKYFWQMPGCCVFQCGQDLKLLISQKRNVKYDETTVADNDPGVNKENKKLFNYSTNMHTERQLILGELYARFASSLTEKDNPNNENIVSGKLVNRALIMPSNVMSILCNNPLNGVMHIYVQDNPCQNVSDNGGISCIGYYSALAAYADNIDFNVYFDADRMKLNLSFIEEDIKIVRNLCDFIVHNCVNVGYRNSSGIELYLRIKDQKLQIVKVVNSDKSIANALVTLDAQNNVVDSIQKMQKSGGLSRLVSEVNNILSTNALNNKQKESLFNSIHNPNNIPNIHYYPI